MSAPASLVAPKATQPYLSGLLRVGLMEFWSRALPSDGPLFPLLCNEARDLLGPDADLGWQGLCASARGRWPLRQGALGQLIADLDLDLDQALVLTLVGEVESAHLVNLAVAELQAPDRSARPAVHLCVSMLESLFGPGGLSARGLFDHPLVRSGVLEIAGDGPMPLRYLRMHPTLWSVLCGRAHCWPGCEPLRRAPAPMLPGALLADLPKIAAIVGEGRAGGVVLRGNPGCGRGALAAELAAVLGLRAIEVPEDVWRNEPALAAACPYAGWLPVLRPRVGPGEVWRSPRRAGGGALAILLGTDGAVEGANLLELELGLPDRGQRRALWLSRLRDPELAGEVAGCALLSGPCIDQVGGNARLLAERSGEALGVEHLAEARRELGAERLRLLAQPVDRRVTGEALIVPPLVAEALDNLVQRAKRRETLWQGLGATLQATRNPGVRALFVGECGTGKTLAASYVATALGAPLYRVDLAAVMNKYIGESEKNLAALLDQAAASDVVLLFDEADSLFGRRTEGKETGERYANMLTNFLLSRIETHTGVVILTTNSRERVDNAFTRRIDSVIEFPLPGFEERLRLWHSHLGERGPGDAAYRFLASYCDLPGGALRNVVISAAACAEGWEIEWAHLLRGLRAEYRKLGRALPAKLERHGGG